MTEIEESNELDNTTEEEAEEESIIVDSGNVNTFYVANSGNLFGIAFSKLFEQEPLSVFDTFEMTSKRNFKNLSPQILETYQELFLKDGVFNEEYALIFFNILSAKSQILGKSANEQFTTYDEFIKFIDKITDDGNKLLLNLINDYVETNYALELDRSTEETKEKKKKVNEELQFSDNHAKTLLKISYLYRIMIPIVSVFFSYNKKNLTCLKEDQEDEGLLDENYEELELEEVNSKIFAYLFEKFAKNPKALRNKLYRLTLSRVSKTAYSDKRFWMAAKNVAITKESVALEIYKKILTNAIPKLSIEKDKNVISFLQSVINNQIDFLFQNKFKYKFIPIKPSTGNSKYSTEDDDDDNNISEIEKMEILTTRKDEGSYIIRKLNLDEIVSKIPEKLEVGVDDLEVKELLKTLNRNNIQENIIAMLTFKFFNDRDALKFISFYQYCYLVVACKKFLELKKFKYLPQILTAKCKKHKERVSITGKKVRPEILSSKKYKDLLGDKYIYFTAELEKPFLSIIATIYSSIFEDKDGNLIIDGGVKVAKIAEEIIDVAKIM